LGLDLRNLIAEGDVVLGERLKTAVIVHLFLHLRGLLGRDAFAEFFTAKKALKDKVRATLFSLSRMRFKELLAEGPAAELVNGLHLLEEEVSFFEE